MIDLWEVAKYAGAALVVSIIVVDWIVILANRRKRR